jgi:hypothetical protein
MPSGRSPSDASQNTNGDVILEVGMPDLSTAAADFSTSELVSEAAFDEAGYLRLNPDVREAIENGEVDSGYSHYIKYGRAEGRPFANAALETQSVAPSPASNQVSCAIDPLLVASDAGLMVTGWIDDDGQPLSRIRISSASWRVEIEASRLVRLRRMDVEKALGSRAPHAFGFFGFVTLKRGDTSEAIKVELHQSSGKVTSLQASTISVRPIDLRSSALSYLGGAHFFGNAPLESVRYLGEGVGDELVQFNESLTRRLVSAPLVERFGPQISSPRGTIIVCLYEKPEFYFLQNCLFSGLPGIEEYEFVYVSNSPEIAETLLREAHSASLIYGLTNSVMILGGNAGFGGANNAAAAIARSDRLLFINPDVFPRDLDWARKHTDVLASAAPEATRLFGVPLYYDDGSLMHGGMYFETDYGVLTTDGVPRAQKICRVEHYGKGAPAETPQFTRARPVPAVTGAFQSIASNWFEELGGFSEQFIFGHYEDADLCLRSLEKGVAPWLQDVRMWHLEGKGSTRKLAHEGGSIVNRWLFSKKWMSTIDNGLRGPKPDHPLLQPRSAIGPALTEEDWAQSRSPRGRSA